MTGQQERPKLEQAVDDLEDQLERDRSVYQEVSTGALGPTAAAIVASTEAKLSEAKARLAGAVFDSEEPPTPDMGTPEAGPGAMAS